MRMIVLLCTIIMQDDRTVYAVGTHINSLALAVDTELTKLDVFK